MRTPFLAPLAMTLALALSLAGSTQAGRTGDADEGPTVLVLNKSEARVSVIDAESGETLTSFPTGVAPHEVAVSPDGRTAVVTEGTEDIRLNVTITGGASNGVVFVRKR